MFKFSVDISIKQSYNINIKGKTLNGYATNVQVYFLNSPNFVGGGYFFMVIINKSNRIINIIMYSQPISAHLLLLLSKHRQPYTNRSTTCYFKTSLTSNNRGYEHNRPAFTVFSLAIKAQFVLQYNYYTISDTKIQ